MTTGNPTFGTPIGPSGKKEEAEKIKKPEYFDASQKVWEALTDDERKAIAKSPDQIVTQRWAIAGAEKKVRSSDRKEKRESDVEAKIRESGMTVEEYKAKRREEDSEKIKEIRGKLGLEGVNKEHEPTIEELEKVYQEAKRGAEDAHMDLMNGGNPDSVYFAYHAESEARATLDAAMAKADGGVKKTEANTKEKQEEKIEELQREREMLKKHIIETGGDLYGSHVSEDNEQQQKRFLEIEEELKKLGVEFDDFGIEIEK